MKEDRKKLLLNVVVAVLRELGNYDDIDERIEHLLDYDMDSKVGGIVGLCDDFSVEFDLFDEGIWEHCGGTGEVSVQEQVYAGEPHTADIGTQKCICQLSDPDDKIYVDVDNLYLLPREDNVKRESKNKQKTTKKNY